MLVLDPDGRERFRLEGYLPKNEFRAQLEMALARVDATHKRWKDAERRYAGIVDKYADTAVGAEALYWRNVARYSQTHDTASLKDVARELREKYPDSVWTGKSQVWLTE